MPRGPRIDRLGLLHHVFNRALGRRTAFESRRDIRVFLALVAMAVREGRIEVHGYVVLSTHFHLFVRSLDGQLSRTMQWIENMYVRWFNRTRRRDGPLFRGRFRSFPVESARYLHVLFCYIDQNPLEARLVHDVLTYPYGSAGSQSGFTRRTPWLCRTLVDRILKGALECGRDRIGTYRQVFTPRMSPSLRRFVARRMIGAARDPDALDDLVGSAHANVRSWMERKAKLADGTRPGMPIATPESVVNVVDHHRRRSPNKRVEVGLRRDRSLWDVALVALLRDVAGETFESITRRAPMTRTDAWRLYAEHRQAMEGDPGYAEVVTDLASHVLEKDHAATSLGPEVLSELRADLAPSRDHRIQVPVPVRAP